MAFVQARQFQLAGSGCSATDTSIVITGFTLPDGTTKITQAMFGTTGYGTLEPGTSREESISFTGVTDNGDGTQTITGVTRGLQFQAPYTEDSDLKFKHAGSSAFVLSNTSAFYANTFLNTEDDQEVEGEITFNTLPKSGAGDPTDGSEFATKDYADGLGGATSYNRTIIAGNAGTTVAAGDILYLDPTDQEWKLADADTVYDAQTQFGIAQGAGTDGAAITNGILLAGLDSNQTGMTPGADQYVSATAGDLTETEPANSYFVGVAKSATELIVNFQGDKTADSNFIIKTGMIIPYVSSTAPSGWLPCDGSFVSVSTYLDLFQLLDGDNLPYGVGTATSFTVDDTTDIITSSTHGLSNGKVIYLRSTTTLPAGLSADTAYYVISSTTNTFQLSLTSGGSAIDITDTGTGTHSWYNTFKLPDLRSSIPLGSGQRVATFDFDDSDVDAGTDIITVDANDWIHTGTALALTTTGSLPAGLSATTYYAIRVTSTTIKLATTVANANDGTAVDITAAAGGGTHTFTLTLTDRSIGESGGEETHALTDAEMPSHVHNVLSGSSAPAPSGTANDGDDDNSTSDPTSSAGSDETHNNMPPYTVVNYIIKT
jgi:microcystin-dependent protein